MKEYLDQGLLWVSSLDTPTRESSIALISAGLACAFVFAYIKLGAPLWEKAMQTRKTDRELMSKVAVNIAGAIEYMVKDGELTPQQAYKIAAKFDSIPETRAKLREFLDKYLKQKEDEAKPKHKLTASVRPAI